MADFMSASSVLVQRWNGVDVCIRPADSLRHHLDTQGVARTRQLGHVETLHPGNSVLRPCSRRPLYSSLCWLSSSGLTVGGGGVLLREALVFLGRSSLVGGLLVSRECLVGLDACGGREVLCPAFPSL